MTTIASDKAETGKPADKLFAFLTDFNNFEKLLPPDKVSGFQSTTDTCSFSVKNLPLIGLRIAEKTAPNKIKIVKHEGKIPFDFILWVTLIEKGPDNSEAQLSFEADLNAMLRMMVEKPLTNFVNMLVHRLKDLPV